MVPTALLYVPVIVFDSWSTRRVPDEASMSGMLDQAMSGNLNLDAVMPLLHQAVILSIAGWGIGLLMAGFIDAAIAPMGSELYLGREASAADGLLTLGRRFASILMITMFKALMIGVALLAFVLPALYVEAALFAPIQVATVEGRGIWTSLERSNALSDGVKNHVLATLTWAGLIYGGVYFAGDIITVFANSPVMDAVLPTVVFIVAYPFVSLCQVVLYYDARERHEIDGGGVSGGRPPRVVARVAPA